MEEYGQNYETRVDVDMPLPLNVTSVPLRTEHTMPLYFYLQIVAVVMHSQCSFMFHVSIFVNWDCFGAFNCMLLTVDTDEDATLITPISDTFSDWFRQNVVQLTIE